MKRDAIILRHVLPILGKVKLKDITKGMLEDYILVRLSQNVLGDKDGKETRKDGSPFQRKKEPRAVSMSTVSREMCLVREILCYAVRERYVFAKPSLEGLITGSRVVEHPITKEQLEYLLALFDRPQADFFRFIAETGCRVSEAAKLRWIDLTIEKRVAVLHGPKTATREDGIQILHYSQEALDIILAQPRESENVFFNPATGKRWKNMNKGFREAAIRAGLVWDDGPLRIHDLRHYFITTAVHAGVPDPVVENMARIDDVRTLRRYTKKRNAAIQEGFAKRREYLERSAGAA